MIFISKAVTTKFYHQQLKQRDLLNLSGMSMGNNDAPCFKTNVYNNNSKTLNSL